MKVNVSGGSGSRVCVSALTGLRAEPKCRWAALSCRRQGWGRLFWLLRCSSVSVLFVSSSGEPQKTRVFPWLSRCLGAGLALCRATPLMGSEPEAQRQRPFRATSTSAKLAPAQVRRGLGSLWEKRDCTQQAELWWMHVVHRRTAVRICGRAPVPGEKTSD